MYTLTTSYSDMVKVERNSDLSTLLQAAAIYLMDPDCYAVTIFDFKKQIEILNFER